MINLLFTYQYLFIQGTLTTIFIWTFCSIISFFLGTIIGIIRSKKIGLQLLSIILNYAVYILCALPLYVQILYAYFVLPQIFSIQISPLLAGILALGFCSSAYTSEIIRSSIQTIPKEQWEAAESLGYSTLQTLKYIILPQVFRQSFYLFCNECNLILKSTALLSGIGALELTRIAMNISMKTYNPIPAYTLLACIYIVLTTGFTFIVQAIKPKEVL